MAENRDAYGIVATHIDNLFDRLIDAGLTEQQITEELKHWDLEDAWADYQDQDD